MCRPLENPVSLGGNPSALSQPADFNGDMYGIATNKQQAVMDMRSFNPIPFQNPMVSAFQKPMYECVVNPSQGLNPSSPCLPFVHSIESEVTSMQDLLDCSLFDDDMNEGDGQDEVEISEEFDNKEIDILYTFLMDRSAAANPQFYPTPLGNGKPPAGAHDPNSGVLTLNLLDDSPLSDFMDLTDDDETANLLNMQLVPPPAFEAKPLRSADEESSDGSFDLHDKNRRLCKMVGCQRRSRSHGLCISHGGGRRCAVAGCGKSSQGGNLCIKHGGGKRCEKDGCDRAAQSNNLCKAHGGGPRCLFEGCDRSSQGGGYCRSHGGGKRCLFEGCDKGTQRGEFCALHGGSRLCGVSGCMRNDRGGGYCATHGGGKRCSQPGCEKPCRRRGLCSAHIRMLESK
ncbi:hypothetical protein AeMF1_001405 [Aphanomyces euteiches]|nr:hypothetical protein AeMF1_001405 [Aphanomyces euteiches]KAH9131422.1 hypothetical protein AeNC1_019639 [Aphanomyces euteiches]